MLVNIDDISKEKVDNIKTRVEHNSQILNDIVNEITQPYSKDLDKYVQFISTVLADGTNPPTDEELEDMCLNLSAKIYFLSGACEQLGIKDDMSKAIKNEVYNKKRDEIRGTIADKDSYAELESQQEQITNICYSRAYRTVKAKVENAQELLQSCKKVLSRRITDLELSKIQRG
jgi:hypothetical protein